MVSKKGQLGHLAEDGPLINKIDLFFSEVKVLARIIKKAKVRFAVFDIDLNFVDTTDNFYFASFFMNDDKLIKLVLNISGGKYKKCHSYLRLTVIDVYIFDNLISLTHFTINYVRFNSKI